MSVAALAKISGGIYSALHGHGLIAGKPIKVS